MRAGIESWLVGKWYDGSRPPWFLRLLEPIYRTGYQHAQEKGRNSPERYRPGLPLVVVGNVTAGGSGKTPLVIRLCQLALDMNLRPGIASTGYGRQSNDTLLVQANSDTRICGDEPVMLAIRTGVPVVVASRRLDAVKALEEMSLDLVISDDGLQRADLERDIEFCVVDGERGLGNTHMIPAGPLREPPERLQAVDYVVSNGEWAGKPEDIVVSMMRLNASVIRSLDDTAEYPVEEFRQMNAGKSIHAVAGIGNPGRFFGMLSGLGIGVIRHGFADHHSFVKRDFEPMEPDAVIIMTEKDAVKCRSLGLENAWYVPVETHLPVELEHSFKSKLAKLMKEVR